MRTGLFSLIGVALVAMLVSPASAQPAPQGPPAAPISVETGAHPEPADSLDTYDPEIGDDAWDDDAQVDPATIEANELDAATSEAKTLLHVSDATEKKTFADRS